MPVALSYKLLFKFSSLLNPSEQTAFLTLHQNNTLPLTKSQFILDAFCVEFFISFLFNYRKSVEISLSLSLRTNENLWNIVFKFEIPAVMRIETYVFDQNNTIQTLKESFAVDKC